MEIIVKYNGDIYEIANELGFSVEELYGGYAILTISPEKIPLLYNYTEIEYIEYPKILELLGNYENGTVCIYTDSSCENIYISGECLNGSGVIAAIIDSGIDYRNSKFINSDKTSKILYLYDLTSPAENSKGTEYTNEQITNAIINNTPLNTFDYSSHGTAIASIITEIASASPIIAVKLGNSTNSSFTRSTDIMRAIKYVIDKAQSLFMPVAINISYGTNFGSHNGNSLFEQFIDTASSVWKNVICIPTGNEGNTGKHFSGTISDGETQTAEFVISENTSNIFIVLYKDFTDVFEIEITAPDNSKTPRISQQNPLVSLYTLNNTSVAVQFIQPLPYDSESYFLIRLNGKVAVGIWQISIYGISTVSGTYNMWLPVSENSANARFLNANPEFTLTIPSTARNVITVAGINQQTRTPSVFSGRGFIQRGYIKPDIAAPSVNIPINNSLYTGTSFAAPYATAASALLMQWGIVNNNDPNLYNQRLKAFLRIGASKTANTQYPNTSTGFGILCVQNTLNELKKYITPQGLQNLFPYNNI